MLSKLPNPELCYWFITIGIVYFDLLSCAQKEGGVRFNKSSLDWLDSCFLDAIFIHTFLYTWVYRHKIIIFTLRKESTMKIALPAYRTLRTLRTFLDCMFFKMMTSWRESSETLPILSFVWKENFWARNKSIETTISPNKCAVINDWPLSVLIDSICVLNGGLFANVERHFEF